VFIPGEEGEIQLEKVTGMFRPTWEEKEMFKFDLEKQLGILHSIRNCICDIINVLRGYTSHTDTTR